ncbi:Bifunctional ligase/repressor BirA [Tsuneonella dongtanensis]|uniref:biotin--[biotin carboxyl-carrier protein] ligase n=1 Tax=Tsuneonella dongtanensis TaxID=692370 RepID=A0A1B2AFB9_9SPHN|nr:biotin--[acetyl-CoA-carboxylase] ligase [Tsuneonella dongtanensis]ANY20725.1 Bifunctional ligase/repressor BirA [Tsuneonella dongtanensis]
MATIRFVAETGSTNADLIAAIRDGARVAEGEWLVADRQTAGRGRQGRTWFDGRGNFMGSTIVWPGPHDPPAPTLALLAGVALYETVAPMLADPSALSLKWPNDLLVGRAKLAGILLEREGDAVVVGIGVNLAAAPQVDGRETIALSTLGPSPDRDQFAEALATAFDRELDRWRTVGLAPLLRRWQAAAHRHGASLTVQEPGGSTVSGTFAGLDETGTLLLRLEDGTTRPIHAGDVSLG